MPRDQKGLNLAGWAPRGWRMEETPWKMGMLGGYTGLSVGRPDGFLNDWHCADLLCSGTSQQFHWLAA